uniref:Transmembrane protein 242 n=1 Tax=Loa loa TaxID=7209 RepID=A0A1I7VYA6_LOALO
MNSEKNSEGTKKERRKSLSFLSSFFGEFIKRADDLPLFLSRCSRKLVLVSAFALGSFFGCALRSSYRHTKGQQLKNIRSGFALGVRALGIATVLSVSSVGLFVLSVSAALQIDSPQQFGQKMVSLCGDRFRIDRGESVATFTEVFETANNSKEES